MSAHEQLTYHSDDRIADTTTNHQSLVDCKENKPLVPTGFLEPAKHDNAARYANGDSHTGDNADDEAVPKVGGGAEKTKKKKKKSKSKKKKKPITGFEEFYADSPLTPAEATYEQEELYSPNRLFIDRIEECIQRYRARRKMDSEQTFMFNKYMFLGGVDSEQRQFNGIAEDIERLGALGEDKDALRVATARDFVGNAGSRFYEPGSADWVVDFEGIVKGFLSRTITDLYLYDDLAVDKAANLIKNFLNYVLTHDVCPEHRPGVLAARNICDIAPAELSAAHQLANKLPGAFNRATSAAAAAATVATIATTDGKVDKNLALVKIVLATTPGFEDMSLAMDEPDVGIKTSREREQTYVVTAVHRPGRAARQAFIAKMANIDISHPKTNDGNDGSSKDSGSEGGADEDAAGGDDSDIVSTTRLGPVGTITLRPSHIDSGYDNVPISTTITTDPANVRGEEEDETYVLEDSFLRLCEIGMKLQLVVSEVELAAPLAPGTTPTFPATIVGTSVPPGAVATVTATAEATQPRTTITGASTAPARQQQKLRIIKTCADVRVSFDTFLPQMLMARWKDPVENTRPPPSVHDLYAEGEDGEGGEGDAAGGGGGGAAAAAEDGI